MKFLFITIFILCFSAFSHAGNIDVENIEVARGFAKVTTPKEDAVIRRWVVERLSKDDRFLDAVMRIVKGDKKAEVSYSSPSMIGSFTKRVKVSVGLPPGAKKWSWSSGGTGVEGYEAVFVFVHLKRGGMQAYYFHRNFQKIDPTRRHWS